MSENIKILVENYDIASKEYLIGKQKIYNISVKLLKEILEIIPNIEEVSFPVRLITENLIIVKKTNNIYLYQHNISFSLFLTTTAIFKTVERREFKLDEIETLIKKSKKSLLKRILSVFTAILDRFWFYYPIMNILFLLRFLIQEIKGEDINSAFIIFLIWLIIFCVYSLVYGIYKLINLRKNPQKIKIEYSIPFINLFETLDISEIIIIIGQISLQGFNLLYTEQISFFHIIWLISTFIMVFYIFRGVITNYTYNKIIQKFYHNLLLSKFYNDFENNEKQYYLQIITHFENKPLISSEKIPKFYTLFSILLTFIPVLSYFFVGN